MRLPCSRPRDPRCSRAGVRHCLRRPAARSWGKRVAGCPSALHVTSQESTSRLAVRRPLPHCQRAVIVLLALVSIAFALAPLIHSRAALLLDAAALLLDAAALLLDAAALLLDTAAGLAVMALAFVVGVALSRLAAADKSAADKPAADKPAATATGRV
jgi:hypothetical protein